MAFEVVYTSVPQGLRPGSRGFCTVAATDGTPRPLLEKLESFSGYTHLHDPPSTKNPVNFTYRMLDVNRQRYYVLSRIGDAGVDYSGRSNKIAHHLALLAPDVRTLNARPSELFADDRFWFSQWDRDPQTLPQGRLPEPFEDGQPGCPTWKRVYGDAGWAGMLARTACLSDQNVTLVLPPTADAFSLLGEAMQLVPRDQWWKLSFSTYFTGRAAGPSCRWRFVYDGTDDARQIRGRKVGRLIDPLKSRSKPVRSDPYVQAAVSGEVSAISEAGSREAIDDDDEPSPSRRPMTASQKRRRQAGARAREARLARSRRPAAQRREFVEEPEPVAGTRFSRNLRLSIAAGIVITLLLAGIFLVNWLS